MTSELKLGIIERTGRRLTYVATSFLEELLEYLFEWLGLILLVSWPQIHYSLHICIGQSRIDSLHANVQTRYDSSPEIFTPKSSERKVKKFRKKGLVKRYNTHPNQ